MYQRCQHNAGMGLESQCALANGHSGEHANAWQVREQEERNRNPTLEAIRQVVREEIERALKGTRS